jgi:murein DD-endopeptidase MepM/ murein hydrolase activator NlpD
VKYLFLIYFNFIIFSPVFVQAKDNNYEKLKEIEKKLLSNQEVYLEILKVEKEVNKNINKTKSNVEKYKKLIKKGFSEKQFLEKYIKKKNKSLIKVAALKDSVKNKKSLLLNNVLISKYKNSYSIKEDNILRIILENYQYLYDNYNNNYLKIEEDIKKYQIMLSKLNTSLMNIELSLKNKSSDLEGLIAETIITEIEKKKNILQKNKIQKKANKIKSLIESFENDSLDSNLFSDFKFNKLQDILPLKKISIKKIYQEEFGTGINLSVINDTKLIAPKNSLVVYADFFKGYGNMIILDLSNGYHLILSGLSNIYCKTGDWLEKGIVLGDINNINNNNLYMEFRFKGKTISPSKWAKLK